MSTSSHHPARGTRARLLLAITTLGLAIPALHAGQFGLFTYQVLWGGRIAITHYPYDAVGAVEIPAEIEGRPVTAIAGHWVGDDDGYEVGAFSGCTGITSVVIPDSVTSISEGAFSSCTGLTSITIPDSVRSIEFSAFTRCTGLTSIEVDPGNSSYSSDNGVLFNLSKTALIQYPGGRSGPYAIPDGVEGIGMTAFADCVGLTGISIPDSVDGIGVAAFSGCTGLTGVTIPDSVINIYDDAFSGCTGLTSVTIPDSVTRIGDDAFFLCAGLTSVTIPDSVTRIGDDAFFLCTGLTRVTIPNSITRIGQGVFYGCSSLTSVAIPASVRIIDYTAFFRCTALQAAVFLGNAPSSGGGFSHSPEVTIYYLAGSANFTSPTWAGKPSVMLDAAPTARQTWLLGHGLPVDADLDHDLNGDGVSLLMAYALNLDPYDNLSSRMPRPVVADGGLSIRFHGIAPGVTYRVETSTNLRDWTTEGVVLSELGPDGTRTATVTRDAPQRFLRLVVE